MSPPMCLKTAKDKYAAKVLEYHARLNKLEIDYLARKSKLEAKNKLLDDLEKEIETRQNKLDNHLIEKSFVALDLDSSSSSLSKTKSNKDILNNTLDDIAQITDQLKSSSLSDDINNKEADPATSSNVYKDNLKPIQPILKQYERSNDGRCFRAEYFKTYEWLEFISQLNKCFCFCCRMFDPFSAIKNGISVTHNLTTKLSKT